MADVNTLLSTPTPLTIQTQFIQNAYFTLPFYLTFITVSVLTGAWFGVLIAFPLAFIVSVLYQQYLWTLVPVPPKSAIVLTGASTGFGEHAAIRLASLGFLVFATVRKEADGKRLQQQGGKNIVPVILDVTNNSQISAAVTIVKQRLDRDGLKLMGLINNAGYAISGPIELATEEDLRKQFDVNVVSVVLITQAFTPLLRQAASQSPQHSARIVLLSSAAAHVTFNGLGAYAASKAAIDAIGASFRYELKRWRIDTVLIEPGKFATNFQSTAFGKDSVITNREAAVSKYGEEVISTYSRILSAQSASRVADGSRQLSLVTDAIVSALLAKQPRDKITAGWDSMNLPIIKLLPTIILDKILGKDYNS